MKTPAAAGTLPIKATTQGKLVATGSVAINVASADSFKTSISPDRDILPEGIIIFRGVSSDAIPDFKDMSPKR